MLKLRTVVKQIFLSLLPYYLCLYVFTLRFKKKINVVFFAMTLPMWRYQHLYEILRKHPKFNPYIVLQPHSAYSDSQKIEDVNRLMEYFDSKGIPYVLGQHKNGTCINIRKEFSPDILFYPHPYWDYYPQELSYNKFYDKLLCYCPYAFWSSYGDWSYNQPLHQVAWKLFYSTELHKKDAEVLALRKSRNVEVVGYPTADDFLSGKYVDRWKCSSNKKRLIWAPHFTINNGGYLYQSNFLWMSKTMIDIAAEYSEMLHIVFKPHPRLFSELCNHKLWGEDKAREYYKLWETMENTQVETGEFIDLFMTSDAMIHDCGSFSVEYHYSEKPVMYVAKDFEKQLEDKNTFGKFAMRQHYVGCNKEDIVGFIENVVLGEQDYMKSGRIQFKRDFLLPPNGKSVAENIMDVFVKSFCK